MKNQDIVVVGVYHYRGIAAATYYRLTLHLNGLMELHNWQDMGGRWSVRCRGVFSMSEAHVNVVSEWPQRARGIKYPEDLSKPLHARFFNDDLLLVPDKSIVEFDQTSGFGSTDIRQSHPFRDRWSVFWKEPLPQACVCVRNDAYEQALKLGNHYVVVEERVDVGLAQVRLVCDSGRTRWFPAAYFHRSNAPQIPRVSTEKDDY